MFGGLKLITCTKFEIPRTTAFWVHFFHSLCLGFESVSSFPCDQLEEE